MSKLHNLVGRPLRLKKVKVNVNQLNRGDHIACITKCYKPYYHHCIVEDIDYQNDQVILTLIEFAQPDGENKIDLSDFRNKRKAVVVRNTYIGRDIDKKLGDLFRVEHMERGSADHIIERARSRIGTDGWNDEKTRYNFLFNNCEHFANWCVEGEAKSDQADIFKQTIYHEVKKASLATASALSRKIPVNLIQKFINRELLTKLTSAAGKVLFLVNVPFEGIRVTRDIKEAYSKYESGYFTLAEFLESVLVSILCSVVRIGTPALISPLLGPLSGVSGVLRYILPVIGYILGVVASYFLQALIVKLTEIIKNAWNGVQSFFTKATRFVSSGVSKISSCVGNFFKRFFF